MKKSLNKSLSVFLSVLLLFILCSCSKDDETSSESGQSATETTASQTDSVEPTTLSAEETANRKIDKIISEMTVEEKVGQMFYVRCPDSDAVNMVSEYHLGGYILFGRDFEDKTKDEITENIKSYQNASKVPMLIGVDEEGGTVVRVSSNTNLRSTPFLSPSDTFFSGGWQAIDSDAEEKADLLLSLGINVNMAPDCDITSDPNAFMYYRSFSGYADKASDYVQRVVKISKNKKLGTVLKHFPGYGNATDTHTGIAYDDRDYSEFTENDFKPFTAGINAGADCVLVAHIIVNSMDSEYPASLSDKVHSILRNDLNFDGVIMTDDLAMDAITDYTGNEAAAVIAAKCGNDILCCSDVETQYPAVLKAVKDGEISESQIDASVKRILKWKSNLGLI